MQILTLSPENQRKPLNSSGKFSHRAAQQQIGKAMLRECNKSLRFSNSSLLRVNTQAKIRELAGLIIDSLEVSLGHFPKVNQRITPAQIRSITSTFLYLKYGYRAKLISQVIERNRSTVYKSAISFLKDCNHTDYKQMVADLEAQLNLTDRGQGNLILSPITIQTIYDDYRIR